MTIDDLRDLFVDGTNLDIYDLDAEETVWSGDAEDVEDSEYMDYTVESMEPDGDTLVINISTEE